MLTRTPDGKQVCVIIPTLNEEPTIQTVIKGLPARVHDRPIFVLVVDGHSTDQTVKLAQESGAQVILQRSKGKGAAMKEGVRSVEAEIYVFIDGDGTYHSGEIEKLLTPIIDGSADLVIGSRFIGEIEKGAVTWVNRLGNRVFNFMNRIATGARITDMLSGYRAIRGSALKEMVLLTKHFEIETEITVEAITRGFTVLEVPIQYSRRQAAASKLKPLQDGTKIFRSILFFILNLRPLFFFSIIACIFFAIGLWPAAYVLYEKIYFGQIIHIPSVVLSALLFTAGGLTIVFGLLAELIVTTRRRLEYSLRSIERKHQD